MKCIVGLPTTWLPVILGWMGSSLHCQDRNIAWIWFAKLNNRTFYEIRKLILEKKILLCIILCSWKLPEWKSRTYLFCIFNTLRPRQNGQHFPDDIFKCIFLNENVWISIKISLKFVPKGPINNNPALVQIIAWRRPGDKPLSEPMMVS